MAPSNSRNTITSPERTRPVHRAGFATGAVSAIVIMAFSCRAVLNGFDFKTNDGDEIRQGPKLFSFGPVLFLLPLWEKEERLLPRLRAARGAVAHQAVEMHADMGGFGRGIGERDGAVEGDAGFLVASELHQEGAAHAEEMKIIGKARRERLD